MKIGTIQNADFRGALSKLMSASLPLKVAYKLHSIDKVVQEEFAKYDKLRIQALEKFGKKKEDGSLEVDEIGNIVFDEGKAEEFVKQLNELLQVEVEHGKIKLEELGEKIELSAKELSVITPILDLE